MGKFTDLINALQVNDDDTGIIYPDTFITDVTSAVDEDAASAAAKIETLETALADTTAKLTETQAHNYELMKSAVPAESSDDDSDNGDNDDTRGVDTLFSED